MAALQLVEQGKLSLDSDVSQVLSSWKIPASTAVPGAIVTLRELLNHTAGLTGTSRMSIETSFRSGTTVAREN
jgi:CubicO group peptidase (beta-lactamase class C family)